MGDTLFAFQSALFILDTPVPFVQPAEFERPKVEIPDAVVYFFQSDVFTGTDDGDINPVPGAGPR